MRKKQLYNAQHKAKVFVHNGSQAVRLPKYFQFHTKELFIKKIGSNVVLSPCPFDWTVYLAESAVASPEFMQGVEDLLTQDRKP